MKESLKDAKQNFINENRPYVYPWTPTKGYSWGEPVANTGFINYGKTPAYEFREILHYQHWDTCDDPILFKKIPDSPVIILAPNSPQPYPIPVYESRWNPNMSDSSKRFYLSGKIWYSDRWKKPYWYAFVYEYNSAVGGFVKDVDSESVDTNE
jgi:hypothetical protein